MVSGPVTGLHTPSFTIDTLKINHSRNRAEGQWYRCIYVSVCALNLHRIELFFVELCRKHVNVHVSI